MEIEFYGANCFRVKTKEASIVVDDTLASQGAKSVTKKDEVAIFTQQSMVNTDAAESARLILHSPGEYEVGDLTIKGIQARSHMDEENAKKTAVVYQMLYDGQTITFMGHVHPDIVDEVIETAGGTDVLVIPIGGNGYTLDAVGATSLIKKIEPDVVIPSYYDDSSLTFEVPAAPLDDFIKASGLQVDESSENETTYKVKRVSDLESGQTKLVILKKK